MAKYTTYNANLGGSPYLEYDISEMEYDNLAKKYIRVVVVPYEQWITIVVENEGNVLSNPPWEELLVFLSKDATDQHKYIFPTYVCDNFAQDLQVSAAKAGWRCAIVDVDLEGYPDWYNYGIPSNTGHVLNAFQTTDRGFIYIDCAGTPEGSYNADKIIDIEIGKAYIPFGIFDGYQWESMGTVKDITIRSWG